MFSNLWDRFRNVVLNLRSPCAAAKLWPAGPSSQQAAARRMSGATPDAFGKSDLPTSRRPRRFSSRGQRCRHRGMCRPTRRTSCTLRWTTPPAARVLRSRAIVAQVRFLGGDGNDYFQNTSNVVSNALGEGGNDTIIGGSGSDSLDGGEGTTIFMAATATILWQAELVRIGSMVPQAAIRFTAALQTTA